MNSKNTLVWLVVAAALFAFIFVFEHFLRPNGSGTVRHPAGLATRQPSPASR